MKVYPKQQSSLKFNCEGFQRKSTADVQMPFQLCDGDYQHFEIIQQNINNKIKLQKTLQTERINDIPISNQCKICLDKQTSKSKFINPCDCRDPIHQNCLLQWINHRYTSLQNINYFCEICKKPYKLNFQIENYFSCLICKKQNRIDIILFIKYLLLCIITLIFLILSIINFVLMVQGQSYSNLVSQYLKLPKNSILAIDIITIICFLGVSARYSHKFIMGFFCPKRLIYNRQND